MKEIHKRDSTAALAAWANYRRVLNLSELGRRIGMSGVGVFNWRLVPAKRLDAVSRATGIPQQVLRPDISAKNGDPWSPL